MSVYYHKFEVRWSDIDANRHLANSAYMQYTAQTRMAFMDKHKMGLSALNRWGIGPVILNESYSFFNEIYHGKEVYVSLEIKGFSEDGGIYQFLHRFYLSDGTHCATAEVTGVWIDTMLRKSTTPPDDILQVLNDHKTENTLVLTRDSLKNFPFRPENIDPKVFQPKNWTSIKLR
ncbi:MAG: thioesterase family protein [Bergeyella zoohelcum]|nr:thioesterase family protein [Bergeyella zoohelcum]